MDARIRKAIEGMELNPGADTSAIEQFLADAKMRVPMQYLDFLKSSNGAEGSVGTDEYLRLWSIKELLEANEGYLVNERMPGAFLFGSDGGGAAYAFDTRAEPMRIVESPLEVLDWDEVWNTWDSFVDFLEHLANRGPGDY